MSSRFEAVFIPGGPARLRKITVRRGAAEVTVEGQVYRDTGRRWTGMSNQGRVRRAGLRLFTVSGTIRRTSKYPAGSFEALVCEAEGVEPVRVEMFGPAEPRWQRLRGVSRLRSRSRSSR
jgi:hypothetical protein